MSNKITDPKKQLALLDAHQEEFEILLNALTGLNVQVSLCVHSADNSVDKLVRLLDAGSASPNFKQESGPNKIWVTLSDPNRHITVFMPDGFDADELHPEPEDLEGYNQAVENANARKYDDLGTPGPTRDQTDEPGEVIDEIPF